MKDGFLLIDKPLNFTSFDVIAVLRKKLGIKTIGHTGTLDPLATGLMVIGVGKATRFLEFHVGHTKEYITEITFGATSETYDAEGPIQISDNKYQITEEEVQKNIQNYFLGEIEQVPPKYSALKINGEKCCNLVRQGKEVDIEIKKRKITIFENELLEYSWPILKLRIKCSSGTYIRSIAHDLGQILNCGGYLSSLRRTQVEDFRIENANKLEEIIESDFLPLDSGLDFPKLELPEEIIKRLQFGQRIPFLQNEKGLYCAYFQNKFQGVAEIGQGILKARKMII